MQAITLHTVKTLSIWGIVGVVLWSQIHQVDHHYKVCDDLNMTIVGVHYTVNPYCARS